MFTGKAWKIPVTFHFDVLRVLGTAASAVDFKHQPGLLAGFNMLDSHLCRTGRKKCIHRNTSILGIVIHVYTYIHTLHYTTLHYTTLHYNTIHTCMHAYIDT